MENLYPGLAKRKNLLVIMTGIASVIALINFIMGLSSMFASAMTIISGLLSLAAPVVTLLFVMNIANLQSEPLNKFAIPGVLGVIALQNLFTGLNYLQLDSYFGFLTLVFVVLAIVYFVIALCFGLTGFKLFKGDNSSKLILLGAIITIIVEVLYTLVAIIIGSELGGFFSLAIAMVLELVFVIGLYGGLYLLLTGKVENIPFGITVE